MISQVCVKGPHPSSGVKLHLQIVEEELESLSWDHITRLCLVLTLFFSIMVDTQCYFILVSSDTSLPQHLAPDWICEGFHPWLCRATLEVQGYPDIFDKGIDSLHVGKLSCTHKAFVFENHRNRITW